MCILNKFINVNQFSMKKTIIFLSFISIVSSVFAENVDSVFVKTPLSEVTVIGFKQKNKQPISSSEIGISYILRNEINSMTELSSVVPNLFMPDYGSRQGTPVYVRGVGSRTGIPSIALYVDGVPHFESSSFNFDLVGISNIEVLRGPQGTLYGRNAIGGVINVYRRSPLDYRHTNIKLGYGSKNDILTSISHSSKLTDNLGLSISGLYHNNDGFFYNVARKEFADKQRNGAVNVGLEWRISNSWKAKLSTSYDFINQNGYPYGILDKETNKVGDINYNDPAFYKRDMSTNGLNFLYNGNKFSFNSQTSYQYIKDDQMLDQDFTTQNVYTVSNKMKQNLFSQEFTFKSNDTGIYNWIVGAFALYQGLDKDFTMDKYAKNKQTTSRISTQPTTSFALYHQSSVNMFKRLTATLGLRYDYEIARWHSDEGVLVDGKQNGKIQEIDSKLRFQQFSPKFALQYDFGRNKGFVYTSVARGFKAGGFNRSLDDSKRTFDPEYSWNYELGLKLSPWGNDWLNADLSFFYIDWKNQQVAKTVPGIGNVIMNAGRSNSKGVELMISSRPIDNLLLQFNYGYTDARFIKYVQDELKNIDYSGNMIPLVPKHTISANATYSIHNLFNVFDKMMFNLGVMANGPFYWNEDNKVKQNMYALLNGKIALSKSIFTLEIWSKNMTNTNYLSYYFKHGKDYAQQGKPFMIGSSILIDF